MHFQEPEQDNAILIEAPQVGDLDHGGVHITSSYST